jgi:septal ring factor EnvC (AmiA/AmiB activator)
VTPPTKSPPPAATIDLKRWFSWLCLALMVVTEILLFQAVREKDAALVAAHSAQVEMRQMQKDLDALKNSSTGLQATEIARLRKQNEMLTAKAGALQKNVEQLQLAQQEADQHLATARKALQLQQDHLQQLSAENQQVRAIAVAATQPPPAAAPDGDQRLMEICINHLRQIDAAKNQWALENNKTNGATPTAQDIAPYLTNGNFPSCPAGGLYSINAIGEPPTCSLAGHALP